MLDLKQQLAPGWTPVNIGLTVILFTISWVFSLIMIAYILWGQKLDLDLGRPATLSAFASRVSTAFRAGVDAFSKNP